MGDLPSGTVTFLFTDIEGSTRLWEQFPDAMRQALARHDGILREAVAGHDGHVVKTAGDGFHAVFATAHDGLDAAVAAQLALIAEPFDGTGPLRVRMGVHTCEAELRDGDYYGSEVNRAARLMSVAHGGQVVVSLVTSTLVGDGLPDGVGLVDLGEHRLRDLGTAMRVFQVVHPGLPKDFPRLRSMDASPGNLPRQATTFVGRDDDIAVLEGFLRSRSLVTLTGVGGVGKTRLAVQAAAVMLPDFADGAWLCELASLSDPDALWDTLAASLGVFPSPGRSLDDSSLEYLRSKRLLLVLDNCEHLLDAAAGAVSRIAAACPGVVVLATSREGLAVAGEQIVAVASLGLPAPDASPDALSASEAVRLFVDRAQDAKSDFVLTDRNAPAVAQLCRRLDGIPLAIELAAARVRSLNPENLVARLDQRFKLLTRGSRAALERQQTLRNTIDWSYDLLGDLEREALNRLSVFAGGADLEAAEAVVSGGALEELDVADVLSQLVDKSLVNVDDDDAGARYRLLESIRQYAQERLETSGDAEEVRHRHADHYVARAEGAGPRLRGRDQIAAAAETLRDTDNFRAAIDWAVDAVSPDPALRVVAWLAVSGLTIGYAAMDWADTAIEIPGAPDHPLFPVVAGWAACGAVFGGNIERATALVARLHAAEAALGIRPAAAGFGFAVVPYFQGDPDAARVRAEEWVERARASGDAYELGSALVLYSAALQPFDPDASTAALEEVVRIGREAGIASVLSLGLLLLVGRGQYRIESIDDAPRALALLEEAIEVGTMIGDRTVVTAARSIKAAVDGLLGNWEAALYDAAAVAVEMFELGLVYQLPIALVVAANAFFALGHSEPAAIVFGAGRAIAAESWSTVRVLGDEDIETTAAALLERLDDRQFRELYDRGTAMDPAVAVAYLRTEADRVLTVP